MKEFFNKIFKKIKAELFTIPNILSIIRILLIPVIVYVYCFKHDSIGALIWVIISTLTDIADGYIARRFNMITDFGKFIDPVADKLLIIGAFMAIIVKYRADAVFSQIMLWALFIIVTREIAVTSLRMIASADVVIAANYLGKLKTVSQMICVVVILLEPIVLPGMLMIPSYALIAISTLLTVISGISYFKAYWPHINPNK